ncbi:MAG: hypothetical protein MI866_12075 [Bacteroidales bacterium]|nr:hypothetical protein [Bacteroidales bacterium]
MNSLLVKKVYKESEQICYTTNGQISNSNWDYFDKVKVTFKIAHDNRSIYLKFYVKEENVRAVNTNVNGPVWEDSCVEFFISFDKVNYYNLEFNCIGNLLGGYGQSRDQRKELPAEVLQKIDRIPSLGFDKIEGIEEEIEWTLELNIPVSTFVYDNVDLLEGVKASCNFYKCGDKQKNVHYLSWNPIKNEMPNFHLPQYFGEISFE